MDHPKRQRTEYKEETKKNQGENRVKQHTSRKCKEEKEEKRFQESKCG